MKTDKDLTIGQRLIGLRESRGKTQKELSKQFEENGFNISDSTISYNENHDEIKSYVLNAYVKTFRVDANYILGYTNAKSVRIKTQAISKETGLSDTAINFLRNDKLNNVGMINIILELASKGYKTNPSACRIFTDIYLYMMYKDTENSFVNINEIDKMYDFIGLKMDNNIIGLEPNDMDGALLAKIQKDIIKLQEEYRENKKS